MMPMVPWGFILTQRRRGAEYAEVFRLDFSRAERVDRVEAWWARGKSVALHLLHQFHQLCTKAGGLGFVFMHDGVFKQRT